MTDKTPEEQAVADEAGQLRKLFIEPGRVTLATAGTFPDERTWACDEFVMVDVTGTLFAELPDGVYRIVASKGYREAKGKALDADLALEVFLSGDWSEVTETGWSVYDSEAKLYLLRDNGGCPRGVNEDVWRSFHARYPGCTWQADPHALKTRFRVISDGEVVAYVAGVGLEGQHARQAQALCRAT